MTKKHLVEKMANRLGVSLRAAEMAVEALIGTLSHELAGDGGEVVLRGFGRFTSSLRPAMRCRNPKTGEMVWSPAKVVVKFKPAKAPFRAEVIQP